MARMNDNDCMRRIQEAIREEFKDSILITIAHRLRTVIGMMQSFMYCSSLMQIQIMIGSLSSTPETVSVQQWSCRCFV